MIVSKRFLLFLISFYLTNFKTIMACSSISAKIITYDYCRKVGIYLLKFNNIDSSERREICLKITIKILNDVTDIVLVLVLVSGVLLSFNKKMPAGIMLRVLFFI